jgi:hypothetical protein
MTTKMARCTAVMALSVLACAGSSLLAQTSPQNPALGLVAKTTGGMLGNTAASEGSSVFSGDYLSTQENGSLLIRIGAMSMELQGSSSAHIYRTPYGAIVELNRGSVVYSTPGTHENLVVVASDVRVTPTLAVADFGRVTIDDPCNVTVTSQRGNANVQAGSESHFVEQGKAYRVRAENEVSYHQYLSPEDGDYHRYHEHRPCAPVQMVKGHAPIAPGQSRFLLVSAVVVTSVAAVSISEALESPHRP